MADFPAFTYPFLAESTKQIQAVNYGVCPIVDLNVIHNKINHYKRDCNTNEDSITHLSKYSLPLTKPNLHFNLPPCTDEKDTHYYVSFVSGVLYNDALSQVDNFIHDNLDEVFPSIFGMDDSEMPDELPDIDHFEAYMHKCLLFAKGFTRSETVPLPEISKTALGIYNACMEIPKQLLCDYVNEGIEEEYSESQYGFSYGNCLEIAENFLIYPSGPLLEIVNFQAVELLEFNSWSNGPYASLKSEKKYHKKFQLNGTIRQILVSPLKKDGITWIGIRSDYFCVFMTMKDRKSGTKDIDIHYTHCSQVNLSSLEFSPYIHGEAVLADIKGTVVFLKQDFEHCTVLREVFGVTLEWQRCLFGSSPRRFILLQPTQIMMLDQRNVDHTTTDLLILPNEHLSRVSSLSDACCRHPTNAFQFFACTTESIILLDERFTHTPLLQINHYLCTLAKHLQCQVITDSRIRVFVSSYKGREVITVTIANDGSDFKLPEVFDVGSSKPPPAWRVISKPYRFSFYDEWLTSEDKYEYPHPRRCIRLRLKQPLIGVCYKQVRCYRKNFVLLFQLSSCGDIFWQTVEFKNRCELTEAGKDRYHNFSPDPGDCFFLSDTQTEQFGDHKDNVCLEWIHCALEDEFKSELYSRCKEDTRLLKAENCSELCAEVQKKYVSIISRSHITIGNESSQKERKDSLIRRLKELRNEAGIVTAKSLGRKIASFTMDDVPNESNSNDILTEVLVNNWQSDEYIPLRVPDSHKAPET